MTADVVEGREAGADATNVDPGETLNRCMAGRSHKMITTPLAGLPRPPKEIPVKGRLRDAVHDADARMEIKAVLHALIHRADVNTLACIPSVFTVAKGAGMNEGTARKALAELVACGVLVRRDRYEDGKQTSPEWTIREAGLADRLASIPRAKRGGVRVKGAKDGTPPKDATPPKHGPTPGAKDGTPPGPKDGPGGVPNMADEPRHGTPSSEPRHLNPVTLKSAREAPPPAVAPPKPPPPEMTLHAVYRGHRPRTAPTLTADGRKALTRILAECGGLDAAAVYLAWTFQSQDRHARQLRGDEPWPDGTTQARSDLVSLSRHIGPRLSQAEAWKARPQIQPAAPPGRDPLARFGRLDRPSFLDILTDLE